MSNRLYGLVPAAGQGLRLGAETPKQYLPLAGEPLLVHSVRALLAHAEVEAVFVVLAPNDQHYAGCHALVEEARVSPLYCGGSSRRDSVFNGLVALRPVIDPDDWVLVHDAARPCLGRVELARLIESVRNDDVGGILAMPVADTLKRADAESRIAATEPREQLWGAQTPQMFRYGTLLRALDAAADATDESSAVEGLGMRPKLVPGSRRNLKVTYPGDVAVAEAMLKESQE